jgi:hypothetical protein
VPVARRHRGSAKAPAHLYFAPYTMELVIQTLKLPADLGERPEHALVDVALRDLLFGVADEGFDGRCGHGRTATLGTLRNCYGGYMNIPASGSVKFAPSIQDIVQDQPPAGRAGAPARFLPQDSVVLLQSAKLRGRIAEWKRWGRARVRSSGLAEHFSRRLLRAGGHAKGMVSIGPVCARGRKQPGPQRAENSRWLSPR